MDPADKKLTTQEAGEFLIEVRSVCVEAKGAEDDLKELALTLDRGLRRLGFDFISMTLNRIVDPQNQRFSCHVVTGSVEYSLSEARRPGIFKEWQAGEIVIRRDLNQDLEGYPQNTLDRTLENTGVLIRSMVNIPHLTGTLVLRSGVPDAFSDAQISFLQLVVRELSIGSPPSD